MGPPEPPHATILASSSGPTVSIPPVVPSSSGPSTDPTTVSAAVSTLPFHGGGGQLSTPISMGNVADRSSVHDSSASSSSSGHLSILTGDPRPTLASTPPVPAVSTLSVPVSSTGVLQLFSQAGRASNPIYTAASISQPLAGEHHFLLYIQYIYSCSFLVQKILERGFSKCVLLGCLLFGL